MMRKALWLLAGLAVLALVAGLGGCGGGDEVSGTSVDTAGKPPPPPPPSTPSKLAFVRDGTICTMNTDGSGIAPLQPGQGQPEWSPNGARIAYRAQVAVTGGYTYCIFTMSPTGQDVVQVTQPEPFGPNGETSWDGVPSWSPDGSEIVFARGYQGRGTSLQIVSADGTTMREVLRRPGGTVADPAWSSDGNWIAFSWSAPGVNLYVVRPNGNDDTLLWAGAKCPDWSPLGLELLYTDGAGIWIGTFDAGSLTPVRQVTTGGAGDVGSTWSPNATEIAFSRAVYLSSTDVFKVTREGTGLKNLTNTKTKSEGLPDWSPAVF